MDKRIKPSGPCPKCGINGWKGPRYNNSHDYPEHCEDWLQYECIECGYVTKMPTLDSLKEK